MDNLKLQVLNGTARLIVMNIDKADKEIELLIDGVMEYMLSTGCSFIESENLNVSIDFSQAIIEQFRICDGAGREIDLISLTHNFSKQLIRNQKTGLKKLSKDLISDNPGEFSKVLVFGKN